MGDAFPSKYLGHDDLKGREVRVTIESCHLETFKDDKGQPEHKPCLKFVGKEKGMLLNMTNWQLIAEGLGLDDSDDWAGYAVVLYPTTTMFGKKRVPCIRVKMPQDATVNAPLPPEQREPVADTPPPPAGPDVGDGGDIPF
jgi:hypothetical protein